MSFCMCYSGNIGVTSPLYKEQDPPAAYSSGRSGALLWKEYNHERNDHRCIYMDCNSLTLLNKKCWLGGLCATLLYSTEHISIAVNNMILKQFYLVPSLHFFMRQAQFEDVLLSEHLCGSAQQLQTFWRRRRRVLITCPKTHTHTHARMWQPQRQLH